MATAPAEYVILDMNANGYSKAGMREKRKRHILDVLMSKSPLVVCLQEFLWVGIHSKGWREFDVPDHFQYEGHKEAGFIFDTREITYSRIDNKPSVRIMYDNMVERSDMASDFFELPRLCVYKIQSKGAPNFEILCASWHGPFKMSVERKKKALDTLVKFLLELKLKVEEKEKKKNIPLLLGGDFNMSASAVKSILPSNGSLMLNTPDDWSVDMFIVSPDIEQIFSISEVKTMKRNSAFDHLHLKIYLLPKNQTGDEGPQGPHEEQTGDEGPHGSEQTLPPTKKKASPSEDKSKQKTKGKEGMSPEKNPEDKGPQGPREEQTGDEGPQGSEQTLPPTKKKASPSEDKSKQKTKCQEGMSPEKKTQDEGPQGLRDEQTGDEGPQGSPEAERGDRGPHGPSEEHTADEGPQGLPEAERGDEGPLGPREEQTGDEGPQGSEQTLPPTKKKASPSEDESKQKTKGQEGINPEKTNRGRRATRSS